MPGIVDTSNSAYAVLRPVPINAVTLANGFWKPRMQADIDGILSFLAWLDEDDQTAPFRAYAKAARSGNDSEIPAALETLKRNLSGNHPWTASTMAWLEACAWYLHSFDNPTIRNLLDEFVDGIVAAHKSEVFLQTYYGDIYENSYDLATPGHLIQAAIAHHRVTGNIAFLECAMRVADDVCRKFKVAGHACIEMSLVELYRETGDTKYLDNARQFLEPWLRQTPEIGKGSGLFEDPWADTWCGRHVVRQPYLCAAAADYLAETDNPAFLKQMDAIWADMTTGKMQITGQIATSKMDVGAEQIVDKPFELSAGVFDLQHGSHHLGFELCEAVGNAFWNWRMLCATGKTTYADQFERVLYNGFLAHISLDGTKFHYTCALASDGNHLPRTVSSGSGHGVWCGCCPPNALRFIASIPGYMFSTSESGLWVHLYDNCRLDWHLADGSPVTIIEKTDYPWDGRISFEIQSDKTALFDFFLRIPGWCMDAIVKVNGANIDVNPRKGSYCRLQCNWNSGDVVSLELEMPILAMSADPRALDFRNKTALMRGPLVYCFEGVDNMGCDVSDICLCDGSDLKPLSGCSRDSDLYSPYAEAVGFRAVYEPDMLNGITTLQRESDSDNKESSTLMAIPYYAWDNREKSKMSVWVDHKKCPNEPGRVSE